MTANDNAGQQRAVADRGGVLASYPLLFYVLIAYGGTWIV
jgi:hypothetical protein